MKRFPWLVLPLLLLVSSVSEQALADAGAGQADDAVSTQAVVSLRLGRTPERTRLVFDLAAPPEFRSLIGDDAREVELLVSGARWDAGALEQLFDGSPVQGLTHERAGASGELRLLLSLREPRRVDVFPLKPYSGKGHRLVVDLYPPAADSELAVADSDAEAIAVAPQPGAGTSPAPVQAPTQETAQAPTQETAQAPAPKPRQSPETAASTPRPRTAAPRRETGPPAGSGTLASGSDSAGWLGDLRTSGYAELTSAYTVSGQSHWSLLRARVEPAVTGNLGSSLRFKLAGRAQGDAAFDLEDDFYSSAVRRDQRSDFSIREAYLDADVGNWQLRLGRQHVVWGEMVGLFLADVVSARDMREFFLQEFDAMRIPQWGVRAERFAGNSHLELLWLPYPSYDEIGEPGADFYPFPVPAGVPVRHERPDRSLDNSHWGLRGSHLVAGWDLSAFYYQGQDVAPTLYSTPSGLELRNERLKQLGATFSKDFYTWVLRGEAVHTTGRRFYADAPGLAGSLQPEASEAIDYVLGVTIPRGDWRLDLQFYGRHLFQHREDMLGDANELGYTALINYGFGQRLEWEVLYLSGLNRTDWSLQPRMVFNMTPEWRLQVGADLFGGDPVGLFGQFDDSDRVYLELRRWF